MKHLSKILFLLLFAALGCQNSSNNATQTPVKQATGAVSIKPDPVQKLIKLMQSADTVILLEHRDGWLRTYVKQLKDTNNIASLLDSKYYNKSHRDGAKRFITLTKSISHALIDSLSDRLMQKKSEDSASPCIFDPHHAILISKSGKLSYVDLCFHCGQLEASPDLAELQSLNRWQWAKLKGFFSEMKLITN